MHSNIANERKHNQYFCASIHVHAVCYIVYRLSVHLGDTTMWSSCACVCACVNVLSNCLNAFVYTKIVFVLVSLKTQLTGVARTLLNIFTEKNSGFFILIFLKIQNLHYNQRWNDWFVHFNSGFAVETCRRHCKLCKNDNENKNLYNSKLLIIVPHSRQKLQAN